MGLTEARTGALLPAGTHLGPGMNPKANFASKANSVSLCYSQLHRY
jgi:hypothetical protein